MSRSTTVKISDKARAVAEKRVAEEGFASLDDYVDSLIRGDDLEAMLEQPWIRKKIEEGIASGNAGPLTRARLRELVEEGIARASGGK